MDETNISELYDKLKKETGDNPQYQQFLESLRKANEKIDALHKTRKGAPPLVTAEDKKELTALFRSIGTTAEKAILAEGDQNVQDVMRSISGYASANYKMLQRYDPETGPKTLPTLMEDARTVTLDTRGAALKSAVSGNLSSRQPITYVNSKGKTVSGVFTPKTVQNYWANTKNQMEKLAQKAATADGRRMIAGYMDSTLDYLKDRGVKVSSNPAANLNAICMFCMDRQTEAVSEEKLKMALGMVYSKELGGRDPLMVLGPLAFKEMAKTLNKEFTPANLNGYTAGIRDGSRIDSRNSAMSSVADLLGMSDVIARSRPMKILVKDGENPEGKIVEGTFMEEAQGLDVRNLPEEAANYGADSLKGTDGRAFRQMADLQVLDYLCGNVDRHGGNLFYQFDKNGKLSGIQGIDNDASFGTRVPEGGNGEHMMTGPDRMKAVSKSTYDAVRKLAPEKLRFILRGHDLSEEQINAAAERLKNLKRELVTGYDMYKRDPESVNQRGAIRVIDDDKWKDLSDEEVKGLVAHGKTISSVSLFAKAGLEVSDLPKTLEKQKEAYRKLAADVAIGERDRAVDGGLKRETERTDKLLGELERVTNRGFFSLHRGTSNEFEDVRRAVQAYKAMQETIQMRMDEAGSEAHKDDFGYAPDRSVSTRDLARLAACSKQIREAAQTYLNKKGPEEDIKNPYTRSRVQAVKLALDFGEKGEKAAPEELESARRNERLADERFARGVDKAEQELQKEQSENGLEPGV